MDENLTGKNYWRGW